MRDSFQAFGQPPMSWGCHPENAPPTSRDIDGRRSHRAATSPTSTTGSPTINQPREPGPYPPLLYPGQRPPQTIHRNDIFFSPGMNYTRYDSSSPPYAAGNNVMPTAAQFYPEHQRQYFANQQSPMSEPLPIPLPPKPLALQQELQQEPRQGPLHPTPYRSFSSPPPLPPKPSLLFEPQPSTIPTSAYLSSPYATTVSTATLVAPPPLPPPALLEAPIPETANPEPDDDTDDLAVALALSKDESVREEERLKEWARQEEEELARALAASMLMAETSHGYSGSLSEAGPSNPTSSPPLPFAAFSADSHVETGPSSSAASLSERTSPHGTGSPEQSDSILQQVTDQPFSKEAEATAINGYSYQNSDKLFVETDDEETFSHNSADGAPTNETFSVPNAREGLQAPATASSFDDDEELPYLRDDGRETPVPPPAPSESVAETSAPTQQSPDSFNNTGKLSYTPSGTPGYDSPYTSGDEAFARRLAEEEEIAYIENRRSHGESHESGSLDNDLSRQSSVSSTTTATAGDLPTYNDAISITSTDQTSTIPLILPELRIESTSSSPKDVTGGDLSRNSSINSSLSVSSAPIPNGPTNVQFPSSGPQNIALRPDQPQRIIGRVSSMSALPDVSRPNHVSSQSVDATAAASAAQPTLHHVSSSVNLSPPTSISNKPIETPPGSTNMASTSTLGMLNANHFVDTELLYGVSVGFTPPVLSVRLASMQGPMPNIISLPYGRCPPLHLAAPSWRHLLKLMARLSNTRLEATVEALAVSRNESLKLRIVIQFIKPHHMTQEWRTILWFTIDHPVPPNAPNASKYHNTNVNVLPWSYTLSSIPAPLKDASDTILSKFYTVPATNAVPFPSLPITFPSLALYLQAALDDSRQQSDSCPLRKLAKMVQTCYPNDVVDNGTEEPEKISGVSGLFKKVIGRGNKKDKKGRGGGNEDTYDLVTPFVPEEWG